MRTKCPCTKVPIDALRSTFFNTFGEEEEASANQPSWLSLMTSMLRAQWGGATAHGRALQDAAYRGGTHVTSLGFGQEVHWRRTHAVTGEVVATKQAEPMAAALLLPPHHHAALKLSHASLSLARKLCSRMPAKGEGERGRAWLAPTRPPHHEGVPRWGGYGGPFGIVGHNHPD